MPGKRFLYSDFDRDCMSLALLEAEKAKGLTHPNPAVGAIVVRDGVVIGSGRTAACGGPHAEINALKKAGVRAKGAEMFVTLEPCCHFGRTPPCTDAIVKAGIQRVVVAARDPFPRVSGRGLRVLRKAGIRVDFGLGVSEALELNEDFVWSVRNQRPWVSLKLAMSLDGCIADVGGNSKWITSGRSRQFVQKLRRYHSAVAVGQRTLETDDSRLSVRGENNGGTARVVFARNEHIHGELAFVRDSDTTRSIIACRSSGRPRIQADGHGPEIWYTGRATRKGALKSFLQMAHRDGMRSILVEGGGGVASELLEAGLVNRVYLFYGPTVLGGGIRGMNFKRPLLLANSIGLVDVRHQSFGNDFMITARVEQPGARS